MILWNLGILQEDPIGFLVFLVVVLLALVVGFTVHEFSHALIAHGEGDETARRMGRLTFNPVKHIDWLGFALILLVGFGWAKPVQVDPRNLRHGRIGMAWVAFAGPLSNFVIAFAFGLLFRLHLLPMGNGSPGYADVGGWLSILAYFLVFMNLMLGFFNLMPLPPLDGSKVLGGLLPNAWYYRYLRFESYGWLVLLGLIGISYALQYAVGVNIISAVLLPPVQFLFGIATGIG